MNRASVKLVVILLAAAASAVGLQAGALRAGVNEVDISPPTLPVDVSGGFLSRAVNETAGPLHARALVLDDGAKRIVIAVADTLMMTREFLDSVKEAASRTTGIPPGHMLISATHTHSAPPLMGALGTDADPEYVSFVQRQLIRVIEGAARRTVPARAGWAVVTAPEYTNCRRWILRPDKMRKDPFGDLTIRANMHPGYQSPEFIGPSGPKDPELSVFAVQSAEGRPIALLANYSMHYVGGDRGVSPDYYGPFCENVRRLLGVPAQDAGFIAMMSQGTSGDQHWMDYSRPKQEWTTSQYAEALVRSAYAAYQKIRYSDSVPLDFRETKLTLSRRIPDGRRLQWAREIYGGVPEGKPRTQVEVYAREQILIAQEPKRELKLQAIRIGDLGIAAWPNEVYAISGLKIKAQSPLRHTFNIELANGADGYIPPPEQHMLGGYTTWPARTAGLEAGAEPRIVDALLGLLEQAGGKKRRPLEDVHGAYAKAILATRPSAYWRGSDIAGRKAQDSSGKGHAGDYVGGVALYLVGPESEGFSGAVQANRSPHYAGGHMQAALPTSGGSYSVALWFYNGLPSDARVTTGVLYSWGDDELRIGGRSRAAGKLVFESGGQILEGSTPLNEKTWYFAVLTRDKTGVRLYLNGGVTPELSGKAPGGVTAGEFRVAAGRSEDASFEGRIDEVAVFDRVLRPSEIARLHQRAGI